MSAPAFSGAIEMPHLEETPKTQILWMFECIHRSTVVSASNGIGTGHIACVIKFVTLTVGIEERTGTATVDVHAYVAGTKAGEAVGPVGGRAGGRMPHGSGKPAKRAAAKSFA